MPKQYPFSLYDPYQHSAQLFPTVISNDTAAAPRPFINWLNDPIWPTREEAAAKSGTIKLDQNSYTLPQNDLPGITPLHLNENLFATTRTAAHNAKIAESLQKHLHNLHRYPINGANELQEAIAAAWHITPEKIVISNGSANMLRDVVLYLLKKGETILVPAPGWSFYKAIAGLIAAEIKTFPLLDIGNTFVYDKYLIADEIEATHPKVVLICSPGNPTGNVMPIADLLWLVRTYPHVDFILDEAYYGFHESYSAEQEQELLASTAARNLFIVRTFSKFYGLANLRLGFVIGSAADAQNLQKLAPVFGVPSLNQALAANRLADQEYKAQLQQEYAEVNEYVYNALEQLPGFNPYQTRSNFILVRHDGRWAGIEDTLFKHGYKIKRETINGTTNYLRITYADITTMQHLISIIQRHSTTERQNDTLS